MARRVGLKYCGGCRPGYDRVALAAEIRRRLDGQVHWVPADDPEAEWILAVEGCPTACADLEPFEGKPIFAVSGPERAEAFVRHVQTLDNREHSAERNPTMMLSRDQILASLREWNRAWERYDLEGVLSLMHADVCFENWTGGRARGIDALRKAWQPWFAQRDFRFQEEEMFVDEAAQKVLFRWWLEWPCPEKAHAGKPERRHGVDVIHFQDGKIINKLTFSKTTILIDGQRHALHL